ncbi:MAG TPA: BON domain-containing protein [Methylotenera sp.]
MKYIKHVPKLILAGVLMATLGCASSSQKDDNTNSKRERAGDYIDDAVITTKVKAAILNEPALKSYEVNVETYKGVVQLSGFVSTEAEVIKAAGLASSIKGVVSVKNDLRVKAK